VMRAIVLDAFGGVEHLRWAEWPLPQPGPGQVRIRVAAIAVNPVDWKMRQGWLSVALPTILGRDVAGTIDAVGEAVTEFAPGDEVFAVLFGPRSNGAYAPYVATSPCFVHPKPRGLSHAQAAALGVAGLTAYESVVRKARVQQGEAVLITGGAGGVGSFAIPLLRHAGASPIIATYGTETSRRYLIDLMGLEADHLIGYRGRPLDVLEADVRERTGGRGVAAAFDFVGADMKTLCLRALDFDGRVVSIVEEPPGPGLDVSRPDRSPLLAKSGTFHFVATSARARSGEAVRWRVYREMMADLTALIEAGRIPAPHVTTVGELGEETIREAHARLETGHVTGKLILTVGEHPPARPGH